MVSNLDSGWGEKWLGLGLGLVLFWFFPNFAFGGAGGGVCVCVWERSLEASVRVEGETPGLATRLDVLRLVSFLFVLGRMGL